MTKKSKILFTIDESSEVYQNAINNIEKKYQNILNNSLKFHETNIINRLPYSVDDRLVIEFKNDTIIRGIDDFNSIYLLFFKSNTKYVFYYSSNLNTEYILLLDNKVVYFIDEISKISDKMITNQNISQSLIPCYIEEFNFPYINCIDENFVFDFPLLYDGKTPSEFNINKIVNPIYKEYYNMLLDKKSYKAFKNYINSETSYFPYLYNNKCENYILKFNDNYYCEFNDDILYFEKGKKYMFIYSDKFICAYGISYNLFKFKNIIDNLSTKQRNDKNLNFYDIKYKDICIPNVLRNISTLSTTFLKNNKSVSCVKNCNSLIVFNNHGFIYNLNIYNDNETFIDIISDINNNYYEFSCIYKRVIDLLL